MDERNICSQKDGQCAHLVIPNPPMANGNSNAHGHIMCPTLHHVPKCKSYHEAIGELVIIGRAHSLSF